MSTLGRFARVAVAGVLLLGIAGCSDSVAPTPADDLYPTRIQALVADSLQALLDEYSRTNPGFCSGLDQFGFSEGLCSGGPGTAPTLGDTAETVARVGEILVRNSRFTGVADASALRLKSASRSSTILRLTFRPQVVHGLEVENSSIIVNLGSAGVRAVSGNHYPFVHVPTPILTAQAARDRLVGRELVYIDFGGKPHTIRVTPESMTAPVTRVILPIKGSEILSLNVAWRVTVGGGPGWHLFVDTVTGDLLETRQLGFS
jgi:hypothetical protein